jgi:hypothetical protein
MVQPTALKNTFSMKKNPDPTTRTERELRKLSRLRSLFDWFAKNANSEEIESAIRALDGWKEATRSDSGGTHSLRLKNREAIRLYSETVPVPEDLAYTRKGKYFQGVVVQMDVPTAGKFQALLEAIQANSLATVASQVDRQMAGYSV